MLGLGILMLWPTLLTIYGWEVASNEMKFEFDSLTVVTVSNVREKAWDLDLQACCF
jgi:hypothetical protein